LSYSESEFAVLRIDLFRDHYVWSLAGGFENPLNLTFQGAHMELTSLELRSHAMQRVFHALTSS
jgi:hypothetical protein